jgi:hypothetical protein
MSLVEINYIFGQLHNINDLILTIGQNLRKKIILFFETDTDIRFLMIENLYENKISR